MIGKIGKTELFIALLIILITGGVVIYKIQFLGYTMTTIKPQEGYFVRLIMNVKGNGSDTHIDVTLPIQSERQNILQEQQKSDSFHYSITRTREARWYSQKLIGDHFISYSFFAQTQSQKYPLPEGVNIPSEYPIIYEQDLKPTKLIQSDDKEIIAKAWELMPKNIQLTKAIQNTYNYIYQNINYKKVRGPTDALSALKLHEASCNGKNRLMVALFRARGIPARIANGLILENTTKRTTHSWSEVLVGERWIPFCPTNGYYAQIPEHYLELSKGDNPTFTHNKKIGFDWKWIVQRQLSHKDKAIWSNANNSLNILSYWFTLKDYHIPLNVIMVILLVPIAATVVSIARNIIGLVPFGTFMPALIAVSFQDTGFFYGSILFFMIVMVASLFNAILLQLRLLHVPRLAIVLTFVVISIMAVSIISVRIGLIQGASVSLFPIVILTMTIERFSKIIYEDSWIEAFKRIIATYIVSSGCYFIISLSKLQMIIAAFPELLSLNIAFNLIIGSWSGLRLLEYYRFKLALKKISES